jgi:hypothetical protein
MKLVTGQIIVNLQSCGGKATFHREAK